VRLNEAFEKATRELREAKLPAGSVAYFNAKQCPQGWAEFKDGRGRFVVAVNPSVPSVPPGSKAENGLSVRNLGDRDTGAEATTLTPAHIPPLAFRSAEVETIQVAGHFQGHPAYTLIGRDPATRQRIPVERVSPGGGEVAPVNTMPPFVVLLQCQKS
jgi:hypothetical protein